MAEKNSSADLACPPAYVVTSMPNAEAFGKSSRKTKTLFGYAVAITTALIVTLILGGVYYYRSLDVIQDAIKKFQTTDTSGSTPITQDIEVNAAQNILVFRLTDKELKRGHLLS